MFTNVSFSVTPSARGCIVSETTGGWRPTTVKNEIGARLATPLWDTVLTHAIARGTTLPTSSLYANVGSRSAASTIMVLLLLVRVQQSAELEIHKVPQRREVARHARPHERPLPALKQRAGREQGPARGAQYGGLLVRRVRRWV